jgi:hypothetical protein
MTSRDRVIRVLNHQEVDRIPRQLWWLPGVALFRRSELDAFFEKYPPDMIPPDFRYGDSSFVRGTPYHVGEYTDAWNCIWKVGTPGVAGEVKKPPLREWGDLDTYRIPWELLDGADFSRVNSSRAATDKFVIADTLVRPFERMQFLRGTENLFMDIALNEPGFLRLRDILHEFEMREISLWCRTEVDGVFFMDDWGTQKSLLISPDSWRKYFKPLYRDYVELLHQHGKYAFMHSDGFIEAIYPDLVEIGVDALNSQLFCMNIEELGRRYFGQITFWGEIDRQHILPFGTTEEVRAAVRKAAKALIPAQRTGAIAQCEWGVNDPAANIEAVFEEWNNI